MPRLSRTQLALAILLIGSIVFLSVAMRGGRPTRPHRTAPPAPTTAAATAAPTAEVKLPPAAPENADFRRYASLESSSIFGTAPAPPVKLIALPTFPKPAPGPPPPPPGPDLGGWTYVGSVTLTGDTLGVLKLGILQSDATNGVSYLAVGDSFMGAKVEAIDQDSIRFSFGPSHTTLDRPRDFPVAPLGSSGGAAAQPPVPAAPRNR